jgi:hypothetical protein
LPVELALDVPVGENRQDRHRYQCAAYE